MTVLITFLIGSGVIMLAGIILYILAVFRYGGKLMTIGAVVVLLGFVFFSALAQVYKSEFGHKCHAAGGVVTQDGQNCVKPGTVIDIP